ncbi:cytochrome c biogenesis heme-transporting ATPase CcmA [Psychrosphaera sp. B3R10]|uniref:cytochrome c biogenesis heme-transporting ATPase CcmA n=1 Tax=unclassified Psychrosphaera TaxID=2641570 RepID=UPI001C088DD3|nr:MULTISPECIES: cytochrome c biogenesis heme-transporting ATPase CcmA [unclassified Psychrosphaera]MBU2883103.1 cytochrome c biogenesis heme-transporting ATPase CcmA [Psychrosphaera sp. I2R16]MBU2988559.1 cytochrome c biogenesis heme-transporting ATPase CcmA [Psychrosphaera sp. B3R10]
MSNHVPLLSSKHLTCIRQDRVLFEDLNFELSAGDIIQVEGPNGVGKTSLLKILAGLSFANEGDVLYRGKNIQQQAEEYRQNLLYLGHQPGVKGELTAEENLEFSLALHGQTVADTEQTLSEVDLAGFEDVYASQLSAGQHRRIALGRLWQSTQKIWILDEPFTAIDKSGVSKLEKLFLSHIQQGGAIILTTHQDFNLIASHVTKLTLQYRFD